MRNRFASNRDTDFGGGGVSAMLVPWGRISGLSGLAPSGTVSVAPRPGEAARSDRPEVRPHVRPPSASSTILPPAGRGIH